MSDNGSWELSADELSLAANRPLITELAGLGVVRASGKDVKALEGILSTYDFGAATKMNDAELADLVGKTRAAIEAAAAQL